MRRLSLLCIIIIILSLFMTGCEKNKDIVHVKTSEKEITVYSEDTAKVTLKITVKDGEKEEVFKKDIEFPIKEITRTIKVNEVAGKYLSNDAVISEVVIEKVTEHPNVTVTLLIIFITVVVVILFILFIID